MNLKHSPKLKPRFLGPFRVVARVGPSAYKLQMQGRFKTVHPVFHISLLKPHVAGGSAQPPPMPVEAAEEEEYEVEKILQHRRSGR